MFVTSLCVVVALLAGSGDAVERMTLDACYQEISELRADINLLNLYNGLNLTTKQIEGILKEARRVNRKGEKILSGGEEQESTLRERELLEDLRTHLVKNKDVPSTLRARYDNLQAQRHQTHLKRIGTVGDRKRTAESAATVEALLTAAQLEVLRTYKPCLIPPRDLRDPVRVGQSGSDTHYAPLIERIRSLPDFAYEAHREKIIDGLVKAAEKHNGKMEVAARSEYAERVAEVLGTARSMDEADFQFNKQDLAREIEPDDRIEAIKEQLAASGIARFERQGQIARFFLIPRAIPLLEKRLKMQKAFARGDRVDLDGIEGAENCRDGKCSIDE